jgi:2-polyprenyl-6-methoxyphenol hydroxylase-like FAD-dependent oxidoreductase
VTADHSYRVVVAGAGPTGLWLAAELALAGVPVLVLEAAGQRSPHSKALVVHPRTVEVLAMRGAAKPALAAGNRLPSWHFGLLEERLDFTRLDTAFPFVLGYPQVRLEEMLERHALALGVRLVRGQAVTAVTQDDEGVTVTARDGAGATSTWRAGYVVGCDGSRSVVRDAAGIGFPGSDAVYYGYVGTVTLAAPPAGGLVTATGAGGTMMLARLPDGQFRVAGVDARHQDRHDSLALEDLRATLIDVAGQDFGLRAADGLSRYGNATKVADGYRRGRMLIAGDAAHIHFPAGGVGLNTGVQDAMNLGWKLAAVAAGRAADALLDTYDADRHPVGVDVAESTLAQTGLFMAPGPDGAALRRLMSGLIASQPAMATALARSMAALDVSYPPLDPTGHRLAGQRVPLGEDALGTLATGKGVLLSSSGPVPEAAAAHASACGLDVRYGELAGFAGPQWAGTGVALIRPDGHLWWAADGLAGDLGPAISDALSALTVRF